MSAMSTYDLVCKRRTCGVKIRCKAHVIPESGWHEKDDLGRKETHQMRVVVIEDKGGDDE